MWTIRDLYVDYISIEKSIVPTHKEYNEKIYRMRELEQQFVGKLSKEDVQLFEELMYNIPNCENDKINEAFVGGYKTGSLLMLDILN